MYANFLLIGLLFIGIIITIFIPENLKRQAGQNRPSIEDRIQGQADQNNPYAENRTHF